MKEDSYQAIVVDAGMLRQPEGYGQVRFHLGRASRNWNIERLGYVGLGVWPKHLSHVAAACTHFSRRFWSWPAADAAP